MPQRNGQFVIFNGSMSGIHIGINGGDYFEVPGVATLSWVPQQPATETDFVEHTGPEKGTLGLGENKFAVYPDTGGSDCVQVFKLNVPTNIIVSSVQLYLFWKNASSVAWVALSDGQPFQASIIAPVVTCQSAAPERSMADADGENTAAIPLVHTVQATM